MLDVRPRHAMNNSPDQCLVNVKHGRDLSLRNTALGEIENAWNIRLLEFGEGVFRPEYEGAGHNLVANVFSWATKIKMVGVYTGRVVAFVKNVKALANLSSKQLPRKAVRHLKGAFDPTGSARMEYSVAGVKASSLPNPTGLRFFNLTYESLYIGQFDHRQTMMTQRGI